jgi:16S rRNA (cytosine1407-C5)-methyltransferase
MNQNFVKKYKEIFLTESDDFISSLKKERKKFFRLNNARGIEYLKELSDYNIIETDLTSVYQYNEPNETITNTISFLTGGIYIQNPSSIIPPMILTKLLNNKGVVLDVSAAPGGKTTALSEFSNRKFTIIANEPSQTRLKSLNFNIEKYGAWNVNTISYDGRILNKKLPSIFDGILLDAPCSNENKIGFNEEVNKNWSEELVQKMKKLQKEIIASVINLLKPGGILIYSTCTFSIEENEENIYETLQEFDEIELIDINQGNYDHGISGKNFLDEKVIRVLPHKSDYDGFFIAALRKKGELKPIEIKPKKQPLDIHQFFPNCSFEGDFNIVKDLVFYQSYTDILKNLKFNKTGIKAGKLIKNNIEISSQFLWEYGKYFNKEMKIEVKLENAIEFLSGFDINLNIYKSINAIFYRDIPVGIVKNLGGVLKNKLDRYFLYGRGL